MAIPRKVNGVDSRTKVLRQHMTLVSGPFVHVSVDSTKFYYLNEESATSTGLCALIAGRGSVLSSVVYIPIPSTPEYTVQHLFMLCTHDTGVLVLLFYVILRSTAYCDTALSYIH